MHATGEVKKADTKGKISLYYHFYPPNSVVSAQLYKELCEGLSDYGWQVTMYTSNRYFNKPGKINLKNDPLQKYSVKRCWRPQFKQSRNLGRLANGFFIGISWLFATIRGDKPDAIILGSDPQFSQFLLPFLKLIAPKAKIIYWCFDLYPEAVIAGSSNKTLQQTLRASKPIFNFCYKFADMVVDIGACMRQRLQKYSAISSQQTLTPWALAEPNKPSMINQEIRCQLYGKANLVLLYSGSLGHAHDFSLFLQLARKLRQTRAKILFAFSANGNKFDEFKEQLTPEDENIKVLSPVSNEKLEQHLSLVDIHLVSLKEDWSGTVVPSKFFGSIAMSKPVLFCGSTDSAISRWIEQYSLGLHLQEENLEATAQQLIKLSNNTQQLTSWRKSTFATYNAQFAKAIIIKQWNDLLEKLIKSA